MSVIPDSKQTRTASLKQLMAAQSKEIKLLSDLQVRLSNGKIGPERAEQLLQERLEDVGAKLGEEAAVDAAAGAFATYVAVASDASRTESLDRFKTPLKQKIAKAAQNFGGHFGLIRGFVIAIPLAALHTYLVPVDAVAYAGQGVIALGAAATVTSIGLVGGEIISARRRSADYVRERSGPARKELELTLDRDVPSIDASRIDRRLGVTITPAQQTTVSHAYSAAYQAAQQQLRGAVRTAINTDGNERAFVASLRALQADITAQRRSVPLGPQTQDREVSSLAGVANLPAEIAVVSERVQAANQAVETRRQEIRKTAAKVPFYADLAKAVDSLSSPETDRDLLTEEVLRARDKLGVSDSETVFGAGFAERQTDVLYTREFAKIVAAAASEPSRSLR